MSEQKQSDSTFFFIYSFDFLESFLPGCGRSRHTIESYRDTLTLFKDFVVETHKDGLSRFSFSSCTQDTVLAFLSWLEKRDNCASTRNHRLAGIRCYIDYCAYRNVAIEAISHKIGGIRPSPVVKREKMTLSPAQVKLVAEMAGSSTHERRNRMIILLLYETAARVSEIVSLNTSDVHLDTEHPYLKISGKGRKERIVPLVGKMPLLLGRYIEDYPAKRGTDILFFSMHDGLPKRLSQRSIQTFLSQYAGRARTVDPSIPEKIHPHMFRRSKATYLYQHGMALEQVSTLLGHSQLETTRIYAKPSMEQLKQAIDKVTPEADKLQEPLWIGREDELMQRLGLRR